MDAERIARSKSTHLTEVSVRGTLPQAKSSASAAVATSIQKTSRSTTQQRSQRLLPLTHVLNRQSEHTHRLLRRMEAH